jgi:redox-sensitive bicupin YhaK (pirin superfamily)
MKVEIFRASSRGHFNHGWLDTNHSFSFADYCNPKRVHFGMLRVVNDDIVVRGEGFNTHSHSNMEIISIPLYGILEHKDSMGNTFKISAGEVQVMSAGTGITHSEFNASRTAPLNFFQIWIFPNKENLTPRYEQKKFDFDKKNEWIEIVSPDGENGSLWISQNAWLSVGNFSKDGEIKYELKAENHGVFLMLIDGEIALNNETLFHRDAAEIRNTKEFSLKSLAENSRVLIIDVPMS